MLRDKEVVFPPNAGVYQVGALCALFYSWYWRLTSYSRITNVTRIIYRCWTGAASLALRTPPDPHASRGLHLASLRWSTLVWLGKFSMINLSILLKISKGSIGCVVLMAVSIYQAVVLLKRFKLFRSPKTPGSQIVVWFPNEFESGLFIIHSPAHSLLWLMVNDSNWFWSFMVMAIISLQVWVTLLRWIQ